MKIHVLSDLHIYKGHPFSPIKSSERIDQDVDVIVLAGDIDEGVRGFLWARETFPDKPVVYVAGNHEFYEHDWVKHLDDMRVAALKYDINFLENDELNLRGIRFLGCSLWTDFLLFGADKKTDAMREARFRMNDFELIKITKTPDLYWVNSKKLIPGLVIKRHNESLLWLDDKLSQGGDPSKTVVITHHAPHQNSIDQRYKDDLLSACYASDLSHLMGKAGLWIHGHMHSNSDYVVNGTRILCNPCGYLMRNGAMENAFFDPKLIVEI